MHKIVILLLIIITQFSQAGDLNVSQLMENNGLSLFDLEKLPNRQRFTNYRYVKVNSGVLSFTSDGQGTNQSSFKIGGLEYIGSNDGEWGGALSVIVNGKKKELMKGNIIHLLPLDGKLYVIEGVAHLGMAGGSISVIDDISNPSVPKLITRLPDAPKLVYLDSTRSDFQRIVIVGSKSIMSLDPYMNITILYWDAFWHGNLDPTSITRYKNNFFIGLPHGVAVIPAPRGESSTYCKEFSSTSKKHCLKVQFYADHEFNKRVN